LGQATEALLKLSRLDCGLFAALNLWSINTAEALSTVWPHSERA
jgi:hypothetical protein